MNNTNRKEYEKMLPALLKAKFGSFLILPFQFREGGFRTDWAEENLETFAVTTPDLTQVARSMMNRDGTISIGRCFKIPRTVLLKEMTEGAVSPELHSFFVETEESRRNFDFSDSYLYVFHTGVAFLALGILYDELETLADMVNPGYADSRGKYSYTDETGSHPFAMEEWMEKLACKAGLGQFFESKGSPFLEAFVYTAALVPERFPSLSLLRQVTFNLHLMTPLGDPDYDTSEEDVRFIYGVIDRNLDSYRWGVCVSSQTISYASADPELDLGAEMRAQASDGLPIVMLALYEKYSCLHFTKMLAETDLHHLKKIQKMKKDMLEFQAYGTLAPANLSRWHNIKRIYAELLEVNDIPAAISDIDHKINILSEHQKEMESRRAETVANIITAFGIVSILASVLSIIDILLGGGTTIWMSMILTTVALILVFLIAVFRRRRW